MICEWDLNKHINDRNGKKHKLGHAIVIRKKKREAKQEQRLTESEINVFQ